MRHVRPAEALRSCAGMATTAQLRALGVTEYELRRAVAAGEVTRVRHGIVALPPDARVHVSIRANAAWTSRPDVVVHRDAHHLEVDERFVVSIQTCVSQCIRELGFEPAVAPFSTLRGRARRRGRRAWDSTSLGSPPNSPADFVG